MSYRRAIQWIADNDDTEWTQHPADSADGTISVTGALVADVFGKTDEQVRKAVINELKRTRGSSGEPIGVENEAHH